MLREAKGKPVTCEELAWKGLYHSAAKRVLELRNMGYEVEFKKGTTWGNSSYRLVKDIDTKPVFITCADGQGEMTGLLDTVRYD